MLHFIDLICDVPFIREHVVKRVSRLSAWPEVRYTHLQLSPTCYICGTNKKLHVHHKIPFHINPSLELDSDNLMTLCATHHLIFGHLGWWRCTNVNIEEDALYWHDKYLTRSETIVL